MKDLFDEMLERERFIELVANGAAPINAAFEVGWTPARLKKFMKDSDFADLLSMAQNRANGSIEEALYNRAKAGNVAAIQMWLFNREPERWRDVRRIEVRSDHRVTLTAVESVKAGVLELLREHGAGAMQALEAGDIVDADVIDDDQS